MLGDGLSVGACYIRHMKTKPSIHSMNPPPIKGQARTKVGRTLPRGLGSMKDAPLDLDPRIDLTKPIYEQVLALAGADARNAEMKMSETVSVAVAKASLSALLARVEAGEEVTITRRGKPIARILPAALGLVDRKAGSWGWEPGDCDLSVFAPMTDEEMGREGWP